MKQTWETDQLPTQSEIKVFAVSPRRLLRLLIVSLRGCAGENQQERYFNLAGIPLGMLEEIKKQKREKQRTKAFEANIFMAIKTQYI